MSVVKLAIGLMSGTSMDGADAALVRTDGLCHVEVLNHGSIQYSETFRKTLKNSLNDAEAITISTDRPGNLRQVEVELTDIHAQLVRKILKDACVSYHDVDILGFHGQTVLHKPEKALTVQIGNGQQLANETGIDVIYDMRQNDIANGGQGAPLVPVYHRALATKLSSEIDFPAAFVNIGGISNMTFVDAQNGLYAFDCGPGNALIDQWMSMKTGEPFDMDGCASLRGTAIDKIVSTYEKHPFFLQEKPGSLDWRSFAPLSDMAISVEDGAASLSYITSFGIMNSLRHLPARPKTIILSGGGVYNQAIVADLEQMAAQHGINVIKMEALGYCSDSIEAEAWAYLAVRSFYRLPLTYPTTTGCKWPVTGGLMAYSVSERSKHRGKKDEKSYQPAVDYYRISSQVLSAIKARIGKFWKDASGEAQLTHKEIVNWIVLDNFSALPKAFAEFWAIIAPFIHEMGDVNFTVSFAAPRNNDKANEAQCNLTGTKIRTILYIDRNSDFCDAIDGNLARYMNLEEDD